MKKSIIIFTSMFPWGNGETFLETEIKYYKDCSVYIIPEKVKKEWSKREVPQNICVIENYEKSTFAKLIFGVKGLFNRDSCKEICDLILQGRLNVKMIKQIMINSFYGRLLFYKTKSLIEEKNIDTNNAVFYSYWMTGEAYAAILLKRKYKNSKAISRCHRYDLYEERQGTGYLPFRKQLKELDMLCPIAEDGKKYLKEKYKFLHSEKIKVFRLGVNSFKESSYSREKEFRILTCSNLIPIKQVDKLVLALACLKKEKIDWTHIGVGTEYKKIKELAEDVLEDNIRYKFLGQLSNADVINNYRNNNYDLFINISSSEGIPVSIMEASSFGIPVIATRVGGNEEIVFDGKNGKTLHFDFKPKELAELIQEFYYMEDKAYFQYRDEAYRIWKELYSAKKNYEEFIKYIKEE